MICCAGVECPIKKTCLRYTQRIPFIKDRNEDYLEMRKCTLQKRYIQDKTKVQKSK